MARHAPHDGTDRGPPTPEGGGGPLRRLAEGGAVPVSFIDCWIDESVNHTQKGRERERVVEILFFKTCMHARVGCLQDRVAEAGG